MSTQPEAILSYRGNGCSHYRFGKYRVTTYPNSQLLMIVLWDKTSKRVRGHNIERDAAEAIKKAQALECTYPACKCIVSTSTSQPEPVCPKGLQQ